MHIIRSVCLVCLLSSPASGQVIKEDGDPKAIPEATGPMAIHTVKSGSEGNRLVLSLAVPTAGSIGSDSLMVWALPHASTPYVEGIVGAIHLRSSNVRIVPKPTSERNVEAGFIFDISPDVSPGQRDTLNFLIIGRAGALLRKSVVFGYDLPTTFELSQNYPNPFNPSTTINYQLPKASRVNLTVYDILGRQVKTLVDDMKEAGYHQAVFDASRLASGVYIYRLEATGGGSYNQVKRMLLLK